MLYHVVLRALPRDEIEEMSVPSYGLTEVGVCDEQMGEFTARLTITGTTTTKLEWVKADGKTQQGVPASVKLGHKAELKELQAAAKDIQSMLPAQRQRIDGLFLQQKTWPLALWCDRYLNHPLIGTLTRRILWEFKTGERNVTAIWFNDAMVDLDLKRVELREGETTVQLWHPIPVALYVRNDNHRSRLVKLIAMCGPLEIDDPAPAITVMMPDED